MSHILLRLRINSETAVKVTWSIDAREQSYTVARNLLRRHSRSVREAISNLNSAVMVKGSRNCGSELRAVAEEGHKLFRDLFLVSGQERGFRDEKLLKLIQHRSALYSRAGGDPPRLSIVIDPRIYVPWPAVFDVDPSTLPPDGVDVTDFTGFWGVRFRLAAMLREPSLLVDEERQPS